MRDCKHLLTTITATFALFLCSVIGFAQTEILINGNFSDWDNATTPTGWKSAASISKETTIFRSAPAAVKQIGGESATQKLAQEISVEGGKTYTMSFWYYVESGDGTDARVWSNWKSSGKQLDDHKDILQSDDYFTSKQEWQNFTVTLEAPASADQFYYEVRTYKGAVVYWDDMSFVLGISSSIADDNTLGKVSVHPNPFDHTIWINNAENVERVLISSLIGGQKLMEISLKGAGTDKIDTSTLQPGVYVITLVDNQGNEVVEKMIKK